MNYLLDITFYAGSDDKEDTDKGLYLVTVNREMTEYDWKQIFEEANELCDSYTDDEEIIAKQEELEITTYDNGGINIDTLIGAVEAITHTKFEPISSKAKAKEATYYKIEQWQ